MRVNLQMPDDLVARIDAKAKELYISRTAYMIIACTQKLDSEDMLKRLPELKDSIQSLADRIPNSVN